MRSNKKYKGTYEYSEIYSDMKGVDLSGDGSGIDKRRFAYAENMFRDYSSGGSDVIESIPGYRKILDTGAVIYGLYSFSDSDGKDRLAVHSGTKLATYAFDDSGELIDEVVFDGVSEDKLTAYYSRGKLYFPDKNKIIAATGKEISVVKTPYIPTVAVNGEIYEQRNLLTRDAYEKTFIGNCDDLAYGSQGVQYVITDEEKKYCKAVGYNGTDNIVYIPSKVTIGDSVYSVRAIGVSCFANSLIDECIIAKGVVSIENLAFYKCEYLNSVTVSDTVVEIGDSAFADCALLSKLHLGSALESIGQNAFSFCSSLTNCNYSGSEQEFSAIAGAADALGSRVINYGVSNLYLRAYIPLTNPFEMLKEGKLNGTPLGFSNEYKDGKLIGFSFQLTDKTKLNGKTVTIMGELSRAKSDYTEKHRGFIASDIYNDQYPSYVIHGCKCAASFDGRIFLSGNPKYPGYVFYTNLGLSGENEPLYFGEFNYFLDGDGNRDVVSMLALSDSLAVFKGGQDGNGSIFYHKPEKTDSNILPVIYPLTYTHSAVGCSGESVSFFDDPVFVSEGGILALGKSSISGNRYVAHRSHNVDPKLLSEDLSKIKLDVFDGYLCAAAGGRIYLADSRATFRHEMGDTEYEWYLLNGIGSYKNDSRVYRYSPLCRSGFSESGKADEVALATVYSAEYEGETVYYTEEGGKRYEVYPTEEYRGGDFYPLTHIRTVGKRLVFASEDGSLSVFNSDKRGLPPPELSAAEGFDMAEWSEAFGKALHPSYYSFAGHAPRYALKTAKDNCGFPHVLKSTVKGSVSVKFKIRGGAEIVVESSSDGKGSSEVIRFPGSSLVFSDIDFSGLSLTTEESCTVPIGEKEKKWVEKQLTLYSESYGSPFGIYNVAYRFSLKGNVKK